MSDSHSVTIPDISHRPHRATAQRVIPLPAKALFDAWTSKDFGLWFGAPATVIMKPEVNFVYFFESVWEDRRHPHYGRFLKLEPNRLVEMTWMNEEGTRGAETIVRVELEEQDGRTHVRVTHDGLPDEDCAKGHQEAWAGALEHLEKGLTQQ